MKKYVNGKLVDMTAEEISLKEIEIEQLKADKISRNENKQSQIDLKASAKAKLVAGEPLTEAEADTLIL